MEQRSRVGRPNRRKTLPSSSFHSDNSTAGDSTPTIMTRSPPAAASRTPQTAPPNRRGAKPAPMNNPFTSVRSSPSTGASGPGKALRKKSRTFEGAADDEDETYRKGPHTLRKRTKIDYSAADFEDELPEIAIPAPRTATRKRRADSEVADDDYFTPASQKRRATSRDFSVSSLPAARRRTPARKSVVEQQSFYSQPSDEDIVKDTIEVVGDSSDLVSSDEASDHEDDENDLSGRISLPDNLGQPSSPTQRKAQEVHQLVSPVEHHIIKQDEKQPVQVQPVSGVAATDMNSGLVIAHPQPIRLNQVTLFNNTAPAQEAHPTHTRGHESLEDFSFQPKREASSPVRPTDTAPQKAVEPEAAGSATGPQMVFGSQENSAPAIIADNSNITAPSATTNNNSNIISFLNNEDASIAQSPEPISEPIVDFTVNGRITNGYAVATEDMLPVEEPPQGPPQSPPQSQESAAGPDPVKASESFVTKLEDAAPAHDEMDIDDAPAEEPDTKMQEEVPVELPDSAPEDPEEVYEEPEVTKPRYAWSHLTPYIDGEHITHSIYPVMVEGSAPNSNGDGPYANGDAEIAEEIAEQADANADSHQPDGEGDEDANADAEGEVEEADRDAYHEDEHPPDSQGQQLSQESAYNSEAPTPALTPRQGSPALPSTAATGTNTPAPPRPRQRFRKQYKFKKVRDPSEYLEFLKDTKKLSYEELWDLLAQVNSSLVAWQDEYKDCTKVVDDQENAQRRAVQDAAFEKKTADLDAFAKVESYIEKDFDIQGYRATIKEKDAGVLEQRWQDRVMASAFGFEYDPHPNKVGNQDPDAQRDGGGEGRQLRSQPQASAKAAEGDGVIVSGKRTRNPPKLFDGVLQDDRSSTPGANKPGQKRRGRAAAADRVSNSFVQDEQEAEQEPQTISPAKVGRKRGPRGKRVIVDSEPSTPVPDQDAIAPPPPEPEQQDPPKRKRGRQPKPKPAEEPEPEAEDRTPKRGRAAKRQSNGHVPLPETTDESRPTSSSSNATISDDGSTYGLRQNKRQRNWREEADVDEEAMEVMQQQKRPRIRLNRKQSAPELAPKKTVSERILTDFRDFHAPTTPDTPQLIVSFKLIGKDQWTVKTASTPRQTSTDVSEYNVSTPRPAPVSAPASAKSSAPPSQAGGEEKDYSTMTKSEKMSASMKKRWLNGSMQGAVNKRKATLAAKKAAAAAAEAAQAAQAQAAQQKAIQFQHHAGILPMPPNHGQ
ncbi:uncharacterized protein CTRU02_210215 [Colletotrichum truncatum]|uniref:Uncharacterized protein n=1 Tax=Colletotrichum truncatum TaxID=5467 RepID=A0ACC3YUL4_COLTU|nr:uncharacterized protein CTRU02_11426 [Colletotrichum truncatum]KAF6785801.1 hypothetical protein CTRU02_11426 [Colletotrichum truncatum]